LASRATEKATTHNREYHRPNTTNQHAAGRRTAWIQRTHQRQEVFPFRSLLHLSHQVGRRPEELATEQQPRSEQKRPNDPEADSTDANSNFAVRHGVTRQAREGSGG
jgi:hypothetical protein